jgi:serine/threonine protein kinase
MENRFVDVLNDLAHRYRGLDLIGAGGMASVFRGTERGTGRDVAVKILDPMVASRITGDRFLREVELCRGIEHPSCVPILAAGEAAGLPYYVMPYVGESLRQLLDRAGPLRLEVAGPLARDVADALAMAHGMEVVHRDIKPANILLQGDRAVVADFGVAKAICAACGPDLTSPGLQIGTPAYMGPEQAFARDRLETATDVFSLGAVLHEMLAGAPPDTLDPRLADHVRRGGPPAFDRRVAGLLSAMLAWLPEQRPTAVEVRIALDDLLAPARERPPWRRPVAWLHGWWGSTVGRE